MILPSRNLSYFPSTSAVALRTPPFTMSFRCIPSPVLLPLKCIARRFVLGSAIQLPIAASGSTACKWISMLIVTAKKAHFTECLRYQQVRYQAPIFPSSCLRCPLLFHSLLIASPNYSDRTPSPLWSPFPSHPLLCSVFSIVLFPLPLGTYLRHGPVFMRQYFVEQVAYDLRRRMMKSVQAVNIGRSRGQAAVGTYRPSGAIQRRRQYRGTYSRSRIWQAHRPLVSTEWTFLLPWAG